MKIFKINITIIVSLTIVIGFILIFACSYFSFNKLFRTDIEAVSELTSENIFSTINNIIDLPMSVSLTMANDTFLRDYMSSITVKDESSQKHIDIIKRYLIAYWKKYKFDSVFFVSAKTGYYYHYIKGIDRILTPEDPENTWYYDFLKNPRECVFNVDNDEAFDNNITVFINCKVLDRNGNILGVIGVGMRTPYIQKVIRKNEETYGIHAFLIDSDGKIQVSSASTEFENVNLFNNTIYRAMKDAIVHNTHDVEHRWYHSNNIDGYIVSRYIQNVNWYLVVEKNTSELLDRMMEQLYVGLASVSIVLVIVVSIVSTLVKKNKMSLVDMAYTDHLTGIRNRNAYEDEVQKYKKIINNFDNFAIAIFDLNNLKMINDVYGHQAGDNYIKSFCILLCSTFKNSPIFRIGGDEFVMLVINTTKLKLNHQLHELCNKMKSKFINGIPMSTAFGYSFYDKNKPQSIEELFKKADNNMYINKSCSKKA